MSDSDRINLEQKFAQISEPWSPRLIAQVNDSDVKIAKFSGEFIWHSHPDADELFHVVSGSVTIELRDRAVSLGPGDIFVVPRGVEHRPVAHGDAHVLMVEPRGTSNTGDAGGPRTREATPL